MVFSGGLPLRLPGPCPSGLVSGQETFEQNCCAANQTFVKEEAPVCCPDESDCYSEVEKAARCADLSWQLCDSGIGFCCFQGWTCYTQVAVSGNGGGVGCSTPGATLNALQTEVPTVAGEATVSFSVGSSSSKSEATISLTTGLSSAFVSSIAVASRVSLTAQTATSSLIPPSTAQNTSSSGLDTAERTGIGVGVSLGVLFLTIIAFLACVLCRRTRSLRTRINQPDVVNTGNNENKIHVPEQDRLVQGVHELHDTAQTPYPRELDGSSVLGSRRELP